MKIEGHLYQSVEQAAFCTSIEHEYQQLSLDNKKTRLCTRNSLPTFPQEFGNLLEEKVDGDTFYSLLCVLTRVKVSILPNPFLEQWKKETCDGRTNGRTKRHMESLIEHAY